MFPDDPPSSLDHAKHIHHPRTYDLPQFFGIVEAQIYRSFFAPLVSQWKLTRTGRKVFSRFIIPTSGPSNSRPFSSCLLRNPVEHLNRLRRKTTSNWFVPWRGR